MRGLCSGIAVVVLAAALAGCGGSEVEEGPVPFKTTDISQFEAMKKQMMETMKTKAYMKKQVLPKETKPEEKKP